MEALWKEYGRWWDGEGERTHFRVRTADGGIYELLYDHAGGHWRLKRVED